MEWPRHGRDRSGCDHQSVREGMQADKSRWHKRVRTPRCVDLCALTCRREREGQIGMRALTEHAPHSEGINSANIGVCLRFAKQQHLLAVCKRAKGRCLLLLLLLLWAGRVERDRG